MLSAGGRFSNPHSVTAETLDSLSALWDDPANRPLWECLFVSPPWLKVWGETIGGGVTPHLRAIRSGDDVLGIAPLRLGRNDRTVCFMGDPSVCDYLDFLIVPGREPEFFTYLVRDLRREKMTCLVLESVRADSPVLTIFEHMAPELGCRVASRPKDVALAVELPETWEDYLVQLKGKQRHEIRRKLRRLNDAGRVSFLSTDKPADAAQATDIFLQLFRKNRPEKTDFMTPRMAVFFHGLARSLAKAGILKFFSLRIGGTTAAMVMCFDYRSTRYLYNNAYDRRYRQLSVGTMSKVLSLKDAIHCGLTSYDFLKGSEPYKHRLGGMPLQLYDCKIELD